jgi:hypothetical protein
MTLHQYYLPLATVRSRNIVIERYVSRAHNAHYARVQKHLSTHFVSDLPVFQRKYVQRVLGPVFEPTLLLEEIENLAHVRLGRAGVQVAVATRLGSLFLRGPDACLGLAWLTAIVLTTGRRRDSVVPRVVLERYKRGRVLDVLEKHENDRRRTVIRSE